MYMNNGLGMRIILTQINLISPNLQGYMGAQWLSGRVFDSRPRGRGFEPHRRHCVVSLSKNINPSLVLVQPRKTRPFITERLLMGRKELNQTNKQTKLGYSCLRPVVGILSKFGSFACNWKCDACGIATFVTAYRDASSQNTMNMNVNKG